MPWWPSLMSSATGLLLVIALLTDRRRPTIRLAATVFLLNTMVILLALWITSGVFAAAPGKWIPFQANKLGAIAAGVLAPGLVTGMIGIGAFVGMVLVRYLTLPGELQQRLPISEPWAILIYAVFAVAILGYRVHSVSLARRMFHVRTESTRPGGSPRPSWRCATSPTRRCRRSSSPPTSSAGAIPTWRRSSTGSIGPSIASTG